MEIEIITLLIAIISCIIALVSAYYSRKSKEVAEKANIISQFQHIKSSRLEAYNSLRELTLYCSNYYTLLKLKEVQGTNELYAKWDETKWKLDKLGSLDIPEIERVCGEIENKVVNLQRITDRLLAKGSDGYDSEYEELKDRLYNQLDWFGATHKQLVEIFEKYLKIA